MSGRMKIICTLIALLVVSVLILLARPETAANAQTIAGHYFHTRGIGSVQLELKPDGTFSQLGRGCFGLDSCSVSKWTIHHSKIVLSFETDTVAGQVPNISVLYATKFKGHWILVSGEAIDLKNFERYGVHPTWCYFNTNYPYDPSMGH